MFKVSTVTGYSSNTVWATVVKCGLLIDVPKAYVFY